MRFLTSAFFIKHLLQGRRFTPKSGFAISDKFAQKFAILCLSAVSGTPLDQS
jgi:hypothetical protein